MINKCKWLVILRGVYTASGENELHAAFIKKATAVEFLKQTVPNAAERRNRYIIVKLPEEDQT